MGGKEKREEGKGEEGKRKGNPSQSQNRADGATPLTETRLEANAVVTCEIKLFKMIVKYFQSFMSHVTTPEIISNYFSR